MQGGALLYTSPSKGHGVAFIDSLDEKCRHYTMLQLNIVVNK